MILVSRLFPLFFLTPGTFLPEPLLEAGGEAFGGKKTLIFGVNAHVIDHPESQRRSGSPDFVLDEVLCAALFLVTA